MKLGRAYYCADCDEVNDGAPRGVCQRCGSHQVYPVARFLERAGVIRLEEGDYAATSR